MRLAAVEARLAALEAGRGSGGARVAALEARLASAEGRLSRLAAAQRATAPSPLAAGVVRPGVATVAARGSAGGGGWPAPEVAVAAAVAPAGSAIVSPGTTASALPSARPPADGEAPPPPRGDEDAGEGWEAAAAEEGDNGDGDESQGCEEEENKEEEGEDEYEFEYENTDTKCMEEPPDHGWLLDHDVTSIGGRPLTQVTCCPLAPSGQVVLIAGRTEAVGGGTVAAACVMGTELGEERASLLFSHPNAAAVTGAAFSPDDRLVATACEDGAVLVWSAASGSCTRALLGHVGAARCVAWSPGGRQLLSCGDDGTLRVWDIAGPGGCLLTVATGDPGGGLRACAWSPDGEILLSGGSPELRLWDAATGRCVSALASHASYVTSCAFSEDGTYIVSAAAEDTVKIWDTRGWTCRDTIETLHNTEASLAAARARFDAQGAKGSWVPWAYGANGARACAVGGNVLVSCGDDGLTVWDLSSATYERELCDEYRSWTAAKEPHRSSVCAASLSASGYTLAAGHEDGWVKIYAWSPGPM